MADIFISYSSKDREKADQLSELLASAGLSVWIDKKSLEISTSWSGEIADAIEQCTAFIILLSPNSAVSVNVAKEVSLASHYKKKILPLDLEPVELSRDLAYHLAGLHRAPMTNIDAIIRAIGTLGLEATKTPTMQLVKETDGRKSLMILPFEDMSPTADNEWFANGIAAELISSLSNVKALKVIDQQTTKEFKSYKGHLTIYAKEMSIRYFIQGSVRKFGDQIKISVTLLDIETGDHLWQDSLRGTMSDIFDIQEQVAAKTVEGLKLHLTTEDKEKLTNRGTENAEAFELFLKGVEYYNRHTKGDLERALVLYEEAVRLDPAYARAYADITNTCAALYRSYGRTPALLDRATVAAEKVREIEGETARCFWVMSRIAFSRGDANEALRLAKRSVETDPKFAAGYDALSWAYQALGNKEEVVKAREKNVSLRENNRTAHFNLLISLKELGDSERQLRSAERALPIFERHARLAPDDYHARVQLASIYYIAARESDALRLAEELSTVESLDAGSLYNLACLFLICRNPERGWEHLRRAVKKGYRNIEHFRRDPDLAPLREPTSAFHAEFEELMKELEGGNG